MNTFSKRHGYAESEQTEITVREDAPNGLRYFIVCETRKHFKYKTLRKIICDILRKAPNEDNWSDSNIEKEVRELLQNCKWYKIYDVIEAIYHYLKPYGVSNDFQNEVNEYFLEEGIGWKLVNGQIEMRGTEPFEETIKSAYKQLELTEYNTASQELHEAIKDLSRRPSADITGAIQHARASLECVAREITGERTLTLGKILEKKKLEIPKPLDIAVEKAWGYASEYGVHPKERRNPEFEEAELIVGISAAISNYLVKKNK